MIPYIIAIQLVDLVLHLALGLIEYERIAASVIVLAAVGFSRKVSLSVRFPLGVIAGLLYISLNVMFVLRTGLPGVPFWLIVISTTALFARWLVRARENNK